MNDLPRMRDAHVEMLEAAIKVWRQRFGDSDAPHMREVLPLVRGLADGSLRCADTKTERVLSLKEIRGYETALRLAAKEPHRASTADYLEAFADRIARWLSTPDLPQKT